jgi:parallel beta-helix repeat protein
LGAAVADGVVADRVARAADDDDAALGVAEVAAGQEVGADPVVLDLCLRCAVDADAVAVVARDDVARCCGGAADDRAARADVDAVGGVAEVGRSRGVDFTTYAASNTLGGTTAAARNVISGNDAGGVGVFNGSAFNQIQGNYIGVNAAGSGKLGNGGTGVAVSNSGPNTIGGAIAGAGNVISGNDGDGIRIYKAAGAKIEHNWIGTDLLGLRDLGNEKCGVVIIGGSSNTIRYNTVCYSGAQGIYVMMGSGNTIAGNSLLGNAL